MVNGKLNKVCKSIGLVLKVAKITDKMLDRG